MTDLTFDRDSLQWPARAHAGCGADGPRRGDGVGNRSLSAGPIREDRVLEWSGSGEFVKLSNSGWLSSRDRSMLVVLEVLEDDDMCPNCVTPWKCNGPHKL